MYNRDIQDTTLTKVNNMNNDLKTIFDNATQDDIDGFDAATFALYIAYISS